MKILVIGLGSIGQRHVRNIRRLAPLEIIAYRVRGNPLPEDLNGDWLTSFTDLDEALAMAPDAALVCTPPATQRAFAMRAVEAGCHVFVEKPIASSWDGMDELLQAISERRRATLAGYNLRFHPVLLRARELLHSNAIGLLTSIRAQVGQYLPDWHPWEDYRSGYSARAELGGGVILDLIHEIDYVRWLAGPAASLSCFAARCSSLEISTEDTAEIIVSFASGAIGNVHLDYVQRVPTRECMIVGENGSIRFDLLIPELHFSTSTSKSWQVERFEGFDRNDMYLEEMRHFLACIEGKEKSINPLSDGAGTLRIALASSRSAADRGAVAFP